MSVPTVSPRHRHGSRRGRAERVPRPWAAVAVVALVVAAVAVADALFPAPTAAPAPGNGDGLLLAPAASVSSSAFCSPVAGPGFHATLFVTNASDRTVTGTLTSVGRSSTSAAPPSTHRAVSVPAGTTLAVDPATGLPAGYEASSFAFAGGRVAVTQSVSGPTGWTTSPCATGTSPQWSIAGGATAAGSRTLLALYNPSATVAVVNLTFLTVSGPVAPQTYQGLTIPAGRLVVEDVGDFVQDQAAMVTQVVAQAGSVVATQLEQRADQGVRGLSLQGGVPDPARSVHFAQTSARPGSDVDFVVGNPGPSAVSATVEVGLMSGSLVPRTLVVPPQSVLVFHGTAMSWLPEQSASSVTVRATGPVVVGRAVTAPAHAQAPTWGASGGRTTVARRWLVPGPGSPTVPATAGAGAESLAVANGGSVRVRVTVTRLAGGVRVAAFTVAPHRLSVVTGAAVAGRSALVVRASGPVSVEEDSGPSGAPGIVSASGFTFAG